MALYNFSTTERVGRRARRARGGGRWNPPESTQVDTPATPLETSQAGYVAWGAPLTAAIVLMLSLVAFGAAHSPVAAFVLFVGGGSLTAVVVLALARPFVWRRRQRRIERVMRGELEVPEPALVEASGDFRRGLARAGLDRVQPVGALGISKPKGFLRAHTVRLAVWGLTMSMLAGALPVLLADGVGAAKLATASPFLVPVIVGVMVTSLAMPLRWFVLHRRFARLADAPDSEQVW